MTCVSRKNSAHNKFGPHKVLIYAAQFVAEASIVAFSQEHAEKIGHRMVANGDIKMMPIEPKLVSVTHKHSVHMG